MEQIFSYFASDPGAVATILAALIALIGTIITALIRNPHTLGAILTSLASIVKFALICGVIIAIVAGGIALFNKYYQTKQGHSTGRVKSQEDRTTDKERTNTTSEVNATENDEQNIISMVPPWDIEGSGPEVSQTEQGIIITFPGSSRESSRGEFRGAYASTCELSGDFDIQVDYSLLNFPKKNGARVGLYLSGQSKNIIVEFVSFSSREQGWQGEHYVTHFNDEIIAIPTKDTSGALRLIRDGNTISGYYFDAKLNLWQRISSSSVTTRKMGVSAQMWSHDYCFNDKTVQVALENLVVNRGDVKCP